MNDRELQIPETTFERQSKQTAWIVSIVVHLCLLLPLIFITCSPTAPPDDLTEVMIGGSGGIPGVNAPEGLAPKGEPDGKGSPASAKSEPTKQTESETTTDKSAIDKSTKESSANQTTTSNEKTPSNTTNPSETGTDDKAQGNPNGQGDKPAGGGGGTTVGYGNIGRNWQVSPKAAASGVKTSIVGEAVLSFTVKWDGSVVNIGKVSGSGEAFKLAQSLLSRARATRAAPGTPDVSGTVRYKFGLK